MKLIAKFEDKKDTISNTFRCINLWIFVYLFFLLFNYKNIFLSHLLLLGSNISQNTYLSSLIYNMNSSVLVGVSFTLLLVSVGVGIFYKLHSIFYLIQLFLFLNIEFYLGATTDTGNQVIKNIFVLALIYEILKKYNSQDAIKYFKTIVIVQLAVIYLFSAINKLHGNDWTTGVALQKIFLLREDLYLMNLLPLGNNALKVMSYIIVIFQLLSPLLAFRRIRKYYLLLAANFHILIFFEFGLFYFSLAMLLLIFVSSLKTNDLENKVTKK
ncbi:HTTM domain-containing protein [Bacteriovorax sp. Seq25_V]|uniref:HTTM domain-containing protein n=1 Tax=Bacteriovorax sp. Seq25_V TaxID=1201288 RepID=UPI00038A4CC9|nr:HTTM domain-containing protein [Bacteriovorax sp. Seq25_V]EQC45490.1 hypothetical protein M900_1840 [Bacteriovorax sp. Seq25_V]